ncbi:MAG: AMP-binding protein, partial [Flavobacteriaceae bacterium]|nr:AMP-binding protein [Flavobacteriaceae bacterium]
MLNYHIQSYQQYEKARQEAQLNPELFWDKIAQDNFIWKKPWHTTLNYDFSKPEVKWFEGGQLNITENCLDRHLKDRAQQTAIIFEPNDPHSKTEHLSYQDLHQRVCKFANVLQSNGIEKGDRVCLYLPMIPELAVAVLACARIGAIHSVVFAGFSAAALATRIIDCDAKLVITSDGGFRGDKILDLKTIVDRALEDCAMVKTVLLVKRTGNRIVLKPN